MLRTIRDHAWTLVILGALLLSFAVNRQDSLNRDRQQVAQLVQGCTSNAARTAIGAAGWLRLSERVSERGNPGDAKSAQIYAATAGGMLAEIAAPRGYEGAAALAEVRQVSDGHGGSKIVVTRRAELLHHAGCMQRYSL